MQLKIHSQNSTIMSKILASLFFTCFFIFSSNGQSFTNGTVNLEFGLNAYTLSVSTEYKSKWLINAGYQTNEFHYNSAEDVANNFDPFADRFFGAVLLPLLKSDKVNHYAGIGAILSGTSAQNVIPFNGLLNYKLTYSLSDKMSFSGNYYLVNGESNELSLGIIYSIF